MVKPVKDQEVRRLRTLLRQRNAKIRALKSQLSGDETELEIEPELSEHTYKGELPPDIRAHLQTIFGDTIKCISCTKPDVSHFAFCTNCESGWAYCRKCGGFSRAKKEHTRHITATHGIFLDMFDKYKIRNSYSKPN